MSLQIMQSDHHDRSAVDPFGQLPCKHARVVVHITSGLGLADDLLECRRCGYVVTLRDLYAAIKLPAHLAPPE